MAGDVNWHCQSDFGCDSDSDSQSNKEIRSRSESGSVIVSDSHSENDIHSDMDSDSDSERDSESDIHSDMDSDSDIHSEMESKSENESESQSQSQSQSDSKIKVTLNSLPQIVLFLQNVLLSADHFPPSSCLNYGYVKQTLRVFFVGIVFFILSGYSLVESSSSRQLSKLTAVKINSCQN